jgi:hypothetical protein
MQVLGFETRISQTGSREETFAVSGGLPQYVLLCAQQGGKNLTGKATVFWLGLGAADIHYITTFGYRHQVI